MTELATPRYDAPSTLAPGDFFRIGDQFHDSALLHFAVDIRLFDRMTEPVTSNAIGEIFAWQSRKTGVFLDALTAIGLLEKEGNTYRNTVATDRLLVSDSPEYIGDVIRHQYLQWPIWSKIGEVLATDQALPFQQERRLPRDADANLTFNRAMVRLSKLMVDSIVALPYFEGEKYVLDLAGGHGTYLAALAKANPRLKGEVWDQENTRAVAEHTFREAGVAERIQFHTCDITDFETYGDRLADVVMLNDCFHYFSEEMTAKIVAAATRLLAPAGNLIILSMTLNDDRISPSSSAGFSFHMLMNTASGGLHPTGFLRDLLSGNGLDATVSQLGRYSLIVGSRKKRN